MGACPHAMNEIRLTLNRVNLVDFAHDCEVKEMREIKKDLAPGPGSYALSVL